MGDQVQYLFFEGTSMQVEMGDYQPWPETVFARAYYGTEIIGKEWEEVDWDHLSWGSALGAGAGDIYLERTGRPRGH